MPPAAFKQGWAPDVLEFFEHWCSLRDVGHAPTSESFLDSPSPTFMSTCYICELTDEGAMVRFHGTELVERWDVDLTGDDIHRARRGPITERSLSNMRHVVEHPCGCLVRISYSTSKARLLHSELIQLPLAVQEGRAPRFACYVQKDVGQDWEETAVRYMETHGMFWVDIGAGVPTEPPLDLMTTS
jgi:hypothetical protein